MNRFLSAGRRHLLMGVACGLSMLALTVPGARAGSLQITVTESVGGFSLVITDNGAFDQNLAVGVINADVNNPAFNPLMTNYNLLALAAESNSPGDPDQATLFQSGTATLLAGGTGSLSILATDVDYNLPAAGPGNMASSSTANYTNAANGNPSAFTSWFNVPPPVNLLDQKQVPSPTVTLLASSPPNPNAHAGNAALTPITISHPFGLTNETVLTLSVVGSRNQFTGATVITAIPEPASFALLLTAVPVTLIAASRRRKAGV